VVVDDEKDTDYAPGGKKKEKDRHTRSRATKRRSESHQSIAKGSTEPKKSGTTPVNTNRVYDAYKLKRVVEAAEERALQVGKPDLAAAVHEIWVQSLESARLTALLEAILTQTATPAQTTEFQDFVKKAKRKLKEAKDGGRKKPAGSGANGTQSLPVRSPSKPTAPPLPVESSAVPSTERQEPHKPKLSLKVKSPHKEHKDSSRRRAGHGGKMSTSPPKKRSGSVGSESSLTSLTSNGDNDMDLDERDELANGPGVSSSKVNGVKNKDHATERGNLTAPDQKLKRTSAEADLVEDERDRQLAAKKRKLDETIKREYPFEESDMRKTQNEAKLKARATRAQNGSLVPPPVALAPNGSRSASVRDSRAASAEVDSPLSDLSPPSSRMSTPHVWTGPPKPSGKRAKTKTS